MAIITISRGTFSGGQALADCVARKLGYRCLSREELLTNAAKEFGVPEDKLNTALMNKPGFLEGLSLRRIHYIAYVRAALCKEAQKDNLVYHGQAGHLLLKGVPHALRLKIIADIEFRIKSAMERNKFGREEAIEYIKRVDDERNKWVKAVYNVDRNDPTTYDMVINVQHITIESACEMVCRTVDLEFQTTPEKQRVMDDIMMAADIRAQIASSRNIKDDDIEILCQDGVVSILGSVSSLEDADRIREVVRKQPGVKDIVSHLKAPIQTRIRF
ncbi:MAG: BON domain-containing protein [Chloroflexi bacterium]|nr:BON domain-containing protein [Chloroflexota bacterium]